MKQPHHSATGFLVLAILFLNHCAAKGPIANSSPYRTTKNLRVGVVSLSEHDLDERKLNRCAEIFPATLVQNTGPTEQELLSEGFTKEKLIESLENTYFESYKDLANFSLLMLLFKNKEDQNYIRMINFLSRQVRTVYLEPDQFSCENIFSTARLQVIASHPPFADIYVDDRPVGEAPVWISLPEGQHVVQCQLPSEVFPKSTLTVPGTVEHLCKRQNQSAVSLESNESLSQEKADAWFLYGLIGALSIGAGILPWLLL